jgi:hypothetical protein
MVRSLSGWPAWASRSPSCLTVCRSPAGSQGGQDPLAGLGQSGRRRVLVIIVAGQDLHAVGQRGPQVGRIVGTHAAADTKVGIGDFPTDHLDAQQDGAGPVVVDVSGLTVADRDRTDDPCPGSRAGTADAVGAAAIPGLVPVGHHQQRTPGVLLGLLEMRIGGQGHVAIGMTGATRDGAPVNSPGDQLSDHEVAQVMQSAVHPSWRASRRNWWEMPSGSTGTDSSGTWENT